MIDAIITAGGIPLPGEPLYPYTQGKGKATLDIAGKPMIQWVLDALDAAKTVDQVVIVGLPKESHVRCDKLRSLLENQEDMLANIRCGVAEVLKLNPQAHHIILVSSDIPSITGEMVDWVVKETMKTDEDIYYNVIKQADMEARFPNSRRSFTHFRDVDICGGDMNIIRSTMVTQNDTLWKKIIAARKNVFKQAALIGYDTLVLLLLRLISLDQAVKIVTKRLKVTGRAVVCPYPEIGMDIDKPHQFEIVQDYLIKKQGKQT